MSFSSLDSLSPLSAASEPAAVRNGNAQAKQAYATGLAFEQVLVNELTQELASTASPDDGSDSGATGLMGGDPASSTYAQMLPGALTGGVMSSGGLGIAAQIATSIDPALRSALGRTA